MHSGGLMRLFDDLKVALTSDDLMLYPKGEGLFVLDTDASNTGIGATLSQMQWSHHFPKEVECLIAFVSTSLTKAQRQYCVKKGTAVCVHVCP